MPFSQRDTMHMFQPTQAGGVQTVIVHNREAKQIALVRSHLRREAVAFAHGDFSDPAKIHATTMPGLAEMEAGFKRVAVIYSDVPGGGRITYTTGDPKMVSAIHRWFASQVDQHGAHAMMGM